MPHVFKDLHPSLHAYLPLLDRSPVQTPVPSAAGSPMATPPATPLIKPMIANTLTTIPGTTMDMTVLRESVIIPQSAIDFTYKVPLDQLPDFKGAAADQVMHLDRSPVQTAWQTRAHSPHTAQDYQIRCHDREEAGEVVKALNERITVKDGVMLRGRTRRRHNRHIVITGDGQAEVIEEDDEEDEDEQQQQSEGEKKQ